MTEQEAADEIVVLRADRENLHRRVRELLADVAEKNAEIARLRAQRDELLATLRKIVDAWVGKTEPMGDETFDEYLEPIIEEAYAAIAAVEEKL
jgi:hypothetical protein